MSQKTSNLSSLLYQIEHVLENKALERNEQELSQFWGVCLYYFYRYTSSNDEKYIYKCIRLFNNAITHIIINKETSTSLHDGLGGFYFLYRKLIRSSIIDKDERLDAYFLNILKTSNSNLRLDLINGVFGNYIITKDEFYLNIASDLLIQFNKELKLFIESHEKNEVQLELGNKERYFLNTGLAHGWAGKLQFIVRYYHEMKNEFAKNQLYDVSSDLYKLLIGTKENDVELQIPSFAFCNLSNVKRLSWCHNDLGIAYSILIYSVIVNNKNAEAIAIDIIDNTCTLTIDNNIGLDNPFLCHGSSGVALIYYQTYLITKNTRHYNKSQYWLNLSYELYNKNESTTMDLGLLQGLSGLGIAVQYLEGKITCTDWLELIQLNI